MSGGRFEYNQYRINDIAESIEKELEKQGKLKDKEDLWMRDEYYKEYPEERYNHTHPKEIQEKFREAIKQLRIAAVYAQRIDWYLSGDDGEESFIKRLDEELKKLEP
jgi:hypothetical protein